VRSLVYLGKTWFRFDVRAIDRRKAIARKTAVKEKNAKIEEKEK